MPAALSIRVSPGCTSSGSGFLTITLINVPAGETATVSITGSTSTPVTFNPAFPPETSPHIITNVPNDTYEVSVSSGSIPAGEVMVGTSSTPFAVAFVPVNCNPTSAPGGCDVEIVSVELNEQTATVLASGTGTIEYAINTAGPWQTSNVFTSLTPGIYGVYARTGGNNECMTSTTFVITAAGQLSVAGPARDWLPVGLPIYYHFQSPDAEPELLTVRIEVSANGINYNDVINAGTLILTPYNNGQYTANIAPYLEATFNPGTPALAGTDHKLFRRYRLAVGKLSVFDGETGSPELFTPDAHVLYATVLTPVINGILTLTQEPFGFNSSNYPGIRTEVDTVADVVENIGVPYTGGADHCPKHPLHLYWLNRSGGWQSWVFDGKHEEGQDIEEPTTWKDENNRVHRASFPDITETVNVYSGFIPLVAYDTVFSILSAIRVYSREGGLFREVNIETGSFQRHKAGQRRKELNFSFTYAQTLTVQNA